MALARLQEALQSCVSRWHGKRELTSPERQTSLRSEAMAYPNHVPTAERESMECPYSNRPKQQPASQCGLDNYTLSCAP
eukprot:9046-Amphidinium_carterae.2